MRMRILAILLLLALLAVGLVGQLTQKTIRESQETTIHAAYLTYTANFIVYRACNQIRMALDSTHLCVNWYDGWTRTPTPARIGQPTLSALQATATSAQRTVIALDSVLAGCATLRGQPGTIDPCPTFWTRVAP